VVAASNDAIRARYRTNDLTDKRAEGRFRNWGNTGVNNSGLGTSYSLVTPTLYIGKGFGEFPETVSWAPPFAVTGQIGYQVPTIPSTSPRASSFPNNWSMARRCNTAFRT
jgi:hypothetical protein